MFTVRPMEGSDLQQVQRILDGSFTEYFSSDVLGYFMMKWSKGQLVAVDLFGHVAGFISGAELLDTIVTIPLFAVDPSCRRRGVGDLLMRDFCMSCMMQGYKTIQLEVKVKNLSARSFYLKHGFVETESLPGFYNNGDDGIRMVKRL